MSSCGDNRKIKKSNSFDLDFCIKTTKKIFFVGCIKDSNSNRINV